MTRPSLSSVVGIASGQVRSNNFQWGWTPVSGLRSLSTRVGRRARVAPRPHKFKLLASGGNGADGTSQNTTSIRSMLGKLRPQEDTTRQTEAEEEGPISAEQQRKTRSSTLKPADPWRSGLSKRWGRLLYSYFNWRQDTWNDLQLFMLLNLVLLALGALMRNFVTAAFDHSSPGDGLPAAWLNVYQVLVVVFGQELPDAASSAALQLFSLIVAAVGFASFALVLALVEQVVLQVLDTNVRQGGPVYEDGHILVLSLADNQRDQEVIWKILSQVCMAYRTEGGRCVVILCQREKLAMEADFRRILPPERRHGTRFVFRQGLPMIPDDLRLVAASRTSATIVISDSSRSPEEADAQAVRVAVLLDELDFPGFEVPDPRTGHIVVEVKTPGALELISYSCSPRVVALPTSHLNATRIARMVCNPVVGMVSQQLWSFSSTAQGYLQPTDGLEGRRLSQVHRMFPTGLVLGVYSTVTQETALNPPAATRVKAGDMLVMMRPTNVASSQYVPIPEPVPIDLGGWDATSYVQRSHDEVPVSVMGSREESLQRQAGFSGQPRVVGKPGPNAANQCTGLYMLPLEYTTSSDEPERVLICGWGSSTFMIDLLRALDLELPLGSEVTLFNLRVNDTVISAVKSEAELHRIGIVGVRGDALKSQQLRRRLDVTAFKCAIILCDQSWLDPDLDLSNGVALKSQSDMLRLDALVMAVNLNIRKLLEEAGYPDINIVCEKLAFEGVTRFEDRQRLPMGICVNLTAYAAKLCFQAAYNPMVLGPYSAFGTATELLVQDASAFAEEGERLSFWQMQARCLAVGQTLMGFYLIPTSVDSPVSLVVNPQGIEQRSREEVWDAGDNRRKIITLADKWQRKGGNLPRLKAGGGVPVGGQWADGSRSGAPVGLAGKKEVGHIVLANGGRIKGDHQGKLEDSFVWVSESMDEGDTKGGRNLKRAVSILGGQDQQGGGKDDADSYSRLLDELASKEDYYQAKSKVS